MQSVNCSERRRRTLKKYLNGLLIIIVVLMFYQFDTFYMVENPLTDRLTIETRKTDPHIKIIAVDEQSLAKVGRWPWPRDIMAGVVEKLLASGAKAVWTDILYTDKSQNPVEDQAWDKVIAKYNNVYLSSFFELKTRQKSTNGLEFDNVFRPVIKINPDQLGHINVLEDRDRVVRQVILGISDEQNKMMPAISVRLANLVLPIESKISWSAVDSWKMGNKKIQAGVRNTISFSYATLPQDSKFDAISISKIISGEVAPSYFADSIVLIGPYTIGLGDTYYTPMSKTLRMFGVEIHANTIQALLDHQIYNTASKPVGLIIIALLCILAYFAFERLKAKWASITFVISVIVYSIVVPVVFTTQHLLLPYFYPLLGLSILYITSVVAQYLQERRERSRVTGIFGRYVSKAVVQEILSSKEDIKVGGVRKDVSLMFVDIRGFTPMSEKMEPEDVINLLNEYLDLSTKAVFATEGTLDKFIGDGVMSIFGAPIEQLDHAERAIKSALLMRQGADELAQRLQEKYGRSVRFGIGINSGPAVIGNIGSHDRLDYTAIGDTVNLAARLESNAKPGQILISKETYQRVKDKFRVIQLESIKVKGKENLVEIYQVEEEL